MADAVTTITLSNSPERIGVHLTSISDGTGESAVIKVDKSTLTSTLGTEPASLDIEDIRWAIQGMTSVRLLWDHTTDDVAMCLTGSGYDQFIAGAGGDYPPKGLADPRSSGGTGDLLLTTNGAVSGATYDITIWLRKTPV